MPDISHRRPARQRPGPAVSIRVSIFRAPVWSEAELAGDDVPGDIPKPAIVGERMGA